MRSSPQVEAKGEVHPAGHPAYRFRPAHDLIYDRKDRLPGHSNGLQFFALDADGSMLLRRVYYSIGGGFVVSEAELGRARADGDRSRRPTPSPTPSRCSRWRAPPVSRIAGMKRANEEALDRAQGARRRARPHLGRDGRLHRARARDRRHHARRAQGEAPGARPSTSSSRRPGRSNQLGPLSGNDWLSVYAMAVNEENAAGSRVVTAPTNGAAGVIPAVLKYYQRFETGASRDGLRDMLLTAAAIGGIIKHNASISGAEVGCQGEVGSASAMAAAALCAAMGGTPEQVENAAEIALEHHLGMTCDPVAGLVQIPCIERNAFGAVKAVTAASLALHGDGTHAVPLDVCVETMRQTGRDMSDKYKETSQAGLAVNVVAC